jgi:transcriptional regulator with XRE-family HTH domain
MCKLNAKKLVEYRNKANMTRSELARKTDVSLSSICKYEKGVLNSSDEVLERMADVLGVDKKELDLDTEKIATAVMEGYRWESCKKIERRITPKESQAMIQALRKGDDNVAKDEAQRAMTKANQNTVGDKVYAVVKVCAINIPTWQRDTDRVKVTEIAEHYDENKYDPIKCYVFNGKLYVADGAHRLIAYTMMGMKYILIELLNIESEKKAAETFLTQSLGRKAMSQNDMWRAAIEVGLTQYKMLRTICISHNVQIKADLMTLDNPVGVLNQVSRTLLRIAHRKPEKMNRIFDLISSLNWNGARYSSPYRTNVISALEKLYARYEGNERDFERLMKMHCKGAAYYEAKVATTNTLGRLFDVLVEDIERESPEAKAM